MPPAAWLGTVTGAVIFLLIGGYAIRRSEPDSVLGRPHARLAPWVIAVTMLITAIVLAVLMGRAQVLANIGVADMARPARP